VYVLRTGSHLSRPDVRQNILPLGSNRTYSTAQHQSQSGESPGDPASDEEKKVLMRMQSLTKPMMILKERLAKAMQKKEAKKKKKKKKEVRLTRRKMRISKRAKRMETRRTMWWKSPETTRRPQRRPILIGPASQKNIIKNISSGLKNSANSMTVTLDVRFA